MTEDKPSPIRPTDAEARTMAQDLIRSARIAALAVLDPDSGAPHVTRIAFGLGGNNGWLTLVSDLSAHTKALRAAPRAGLLLGEAPTKGDPLAFPRLSVAVETRFVPHGTEEHAAHRAAWLTHHPKAQLYMDFADFTFVSFMPLSADLNGGFGKAYRLTPDDLSLT
ncbi:MAG: pyridoxamine 5-phosphate oxidase [Rhodobacteraceae bacterium]|nr:MAG: pyridoxamine 5-phosphate oxidase [Paracoccaceae bacterium]